MKQSFFLFYQNNLNTERYDDDDDDACISWMTKIMILNFNNRKWVPIAPTFNQQQANTNNTTYFPIQ